MNSFFVFFSTSLLIIFINTSANAQNTNNNEPKWYEKPEITFPVILAFGGVLAHLLNDKLVNKQKEIVEQGLLNFKKELTEERRFYFEKLEKLETNTDNKLNTLLQNQTKFNTKFENSRADLNNLEVEIEKINGKVAVLENRVENINNYLGARNSDFSTNQRL